MKKKIIFLVTFIFLADIVYSAESFKYQGYILNRYSTDSSREDSVLNPRHSLYTPSNFTNNVEAVMRMNYSFVKDTNVILNTRYEQFNQQNQEDIKGYLDEAYFKTFLKSKCILSIGKINIVDGVGLSYNPSDFLNDRVTRNNENVLKRADEEKLSREGSYITRAEIFTKYINMNFMYSPRFENTKVVEDRYLVKFSKSLDATDVAVNYMHGDYDGVGCNISRAVGDALEIHTEVGVRNDSQQKGIREVAPYQYKNYLLHDKNDVLTRLLIGGQYTFTNKTNVILEYIFNQEGYSQDEWDKIYSLAKNNGDMIYNPPTGYPSGLFKDNLNFISNTIYDSRYLRQHYAFLRITNPEISKKIEATVDTLINLEDRSLVAMPSIDWKLIEGHMTLRIGTMLCVGDKKSEFGMTPVERYVYGSLKYFF